jgi:hypothetical protein
MLNPWLSLPFQAARLGWEAQTILVDQLMRITATSNPASALDALKMAPLAEDWGAVAITPSSPVGARVPARSSKHFQAAQKVMKKHKKQGESKHSRSKWLWIRSQSPKK